MKPSTVYNLLVLWTKIEKLTPDGSYDTKVNEGLPLDVMNADRNSSGDSLCVG